MESFTQLKEEWERSGRVRVNTDFSDGTIFGSASVNWAFRAWHDYCHLTLGADFSKEGEGRAAQLQISHLISHYPTHPLLPLFISLVEIEVNEQVNYFFETGEFPCNQFDFTLNCLRKRGFEYVNE